MKRFISVFGANGSGKTSLVKRILMSDFVEDVDGDFLFDEFEFFEKKSKFGSYSVSKGGKVVAAGGYSVKCGGADTIKASSDYYRIIDFLSDKYPDSTICVEGVIERSFDDLSNCYKKLEEKGFEVYLIKLDVSLDTAVNRVCGRNGKMPKVNLIQDKIKNIGRLFQKFQDCGKFNCFIIDTNDKSIDEIFSEVENTI